MKTRLAVLLLCASCVPLFSQAATYDQTIAASRATIASLMETHDIPGCTIVLVESQRVVWAEGFGYANKETQTPVTTNTVMAIGSVSKMLTALMALQIADEGTFDLDASLTNELPEFAMQPRFAGQADGWTLRSLLTHHSGLPGDIYNGSFTTGSYWPGYTPWLIDYFAADFPLAPPNLLASYCNSGFNIVAEAIARRDGVDFTDAAEARLFAPLDMPYSSFLLDKATITNHLATGYNADGSPSPDLVANMPATGGAFSRPLDMAQLIKLMLANGEYNGMEFLSTNALAQFGAESPGPLDVDNFFRPGLGLDTVADPALSYAGRTWLKNGSTGKFESLFEVLPDQQLGAFVNINCANSMTFVILRAVLANAVLEKSGLSPTEVSPLPEVDEEIWSAAQLQAVEGWYATKEGADRFIAETNGTLSHIPNAQSSTEVITNVRPHVNGRFYVPGSPEQQWAFTNRAGYDVALRYGSDGGLRDVAIYGGYAETLHGTRFTPPAISAAWSNRCGTFWMAENIMVGDGMLAGGDPSGCMLSCENGLLSLQSSGGSGVLIPTNDTLAFVAGLSTRGDSAVRVETNAGGQERLWFGGYRCVRLEDIPAITQQGVVEVQTERHTNALLMLKGSEAFRHMVLTAETNAPDAVLTVFSLDANEAIEQGTGTVEWVCDSDAALISIGTTNARTFSVKAVDVTETRTAMQNTLAQFSELPGFGVAAQEPGFLPVVLAEGYAAVNPNRPLTGDEHFHIASISKTYTAAAIFLLQQRGLLNLSDTVAAVVPELKVPRGGEITIERLLEHRSGLPDANNSAWIDGKLNKDPLLEFTVKEIVAVASNLFPNLMFEPGADYHYTDTGFNILAAIVEKISGTNYQAFVSREILAPLGMTNTFVPYNDEVNVPEPAMNAYATIHGEIQDRSVWCPSVEFGCGSLIASLRDLLAMPYGFFVETNVLNAATHALMMDPLSPGDLSTYGRGCSLMPGLGWGHDGTMWGSLATARVDTNHGVSVAACMNMQYEDERLLPCLFAMHGAAALLKNALGFEADDLGRKAPYIFPLLGSTRQGAAYRYQPVTINFPTNWIIVGLPSGLSYDPVRGEISGVTTAIGSHSITITAQNAYGSVSTNLMLEVKTGYSNTIAVVSNAIVAAMAEEGTVGVSIALVDDQEIVWSQGFGWADREAGIPVDTDTVFRIGSVSKAFTAATVLQYAERGLLDLEAPFTNYTPGVTWKSRYPAARPITTIDLMTHQSGLPGDLFRAGFLTRPLGRGYAETTNDLAQTYPILEPGTLNNYCNVGFVLLEGIAEAAASSEGDSRPFDQLANARLFDILGMDGTSYKFDKPAIVNHLALPYLAGQRLPLEYVEIYGTGSLYSRPVDLAQFIKALFADGVPVLRPETCEHMLADQSTNAVFDFLQWPHSGLGWDTVSDPRLDYAGPAVWKNGGTIAYSAQFFFLPEKKLGVAIAASSSSKIPTTVDAVALQQALLERDGLPIPTNALAYPTNSATIAQTNLDALAGIYVGSAGYDLVEAHLGSLSYRRNAPQNPNALSNLTLRTNGWFMSDDKPSALLCFTNCNGRDLVLSRQADGPNEYRTILAERFAPPALSAAWSNRLDKTWVARNVPVDSYFYAVGVSPQLHLRQSDGVLHVECGGSPENRALAPTNDSVAWLPGILNRGDSALQIVDIDGVEYLLYGGYFYGPEPDALSLAASISDTIERAGFSRWYEIQPASPPEPVGGISNVEYTLTLSGAPANFLLRLTEADGVTPVAERTGNGTLDLVSGPNPLLLSIQPGSEGLQTGDFEITFNIPLLVRELVLSSTNATLVWQGPTGTLVSVEAAPFLALTNTFSPALENIPTPSPLLQQTLPLPSDSTGFFRISAP